MIIRGSCHCENISFRLDWSPEPLEIPARVCSCSFCQKHGGVWTSCPTGSLEVSVRNSELHSSYAFGTKTAAFHVCTKCGVVPIVTSVIDGATYAVVSVNAMDGIDPALVKRSPITFEGEDANARLARRRKAWIPSVRIARGDA